MTLKKRLEQERKNVKTFFRTKDENGEAFFKIVNSNNTNPLGYRKSKKKPLISGDEYSENQIKKLRWYTKLLSGRQQLDMKIKSDVAKSKYTFKRGKVSKTNFLASIEGEIPYGLGNYEPSLVVYDREIHKVAGWFDKNKGAAYGEMVDEEIFYVKVLSGQSIPSSNDLYVKQKAIQLSFRKHISAFLFNRVFGS